MNRTVGALVMAGAHESGMKYPSYSICINTQKNRIETGTICCTQVIVHMVDSWPDMGVDGFRCDVNSISKDFTVAQCGGKARICMNSCMRCIKVKAIES